MFSSAANPHFTARGNLTRLSDPEAGSVLVPASLARQEGERRVAPHPGRALGSDNEKIYGEWLGLSDEERAALAAEGVI